MALRGRVRPWRVLAVAAGIVAGVVGCGGSAQTTSSSPAGSPGPTQTSPDTTPPAIVITAPTTAGSYVATTTSLSLAGTATDNVGVKTVTWRNTTSGASGTASGTSTWNVAALPLVAGHNAIVVTARDAAGNTGTAALDATFNLTGQASLSGGVDSSLVDRSGVNGVYLYAGSVVPDDRGGAGAQPLAVATVAQDNGACTFSYRFDALPAGSYTVAFTNQAANDNPSVDDAISFSGTATVAVPVNGGALHNFAAARVLQVGPTRSLQRPSDAAAIAQDGDVIEIDAGEYLDDIVVWRRNRLTLRGVGGGRAYMHATQTIPFDGTDAGNGKGIWVTAGRGITVENVEFSGAKVPDENGAGIRGDGPDLTVCNGYFHDNENGILGGGGNVLIEYSEFANNGFGDGFTHNMYISSGTNRFTLRYSYTHHAKIGHTVKTRARENYILYNRIMDEATGTSSYNIDVPDAGLTYIIGNLIQQGPDTDNSTLVAYGAESASNGTQELYVVNNTFVNDLHSGAFLSVRSGTTARIVNNIFSGGGTVLSGPGTLTTNLVSNSPGLADSANYDYELTAAATGAIDQGSDPGTSPAGFDLTPTSEYVHPYNRRDRPVVGPLDIGAYEYVP
jgi:hypothetical protein